MVYKHNNASNCPGDYGAVKYEYKPYKKPELKLWLECGLSPRDANFVIDAGTVEADQSFVLNKVIVDAEHLIRPVVKLEFSSLIYFLAAADAEGDLEVDLLFTLVRSCNGNTETLQSWRYLKRFDFTETDGLTVEASEPFTVTYCDRACPNCCEYRMIVEGRGFTGTFTNLRVTTPELGAFVQGLSNQC